MRFARIFVSFCFVFCFASAASAANFTVTKTVDTNDGVCDADCSLREAVAAANAAAGNDSIYFALPLFGSPQTITLTLGEIVFGANGSTTVYGAGANRLTISGGGASRIFSTGANVVANIHHLRLTGGNGAGAVNTGRGGAVYNVGGTLVITNSILTGNSATLGGATNNAAATGGVDAHLTVINCFISNNSATSSGAAMQNFSTSQMHIIGTTVSNNTTSTTGIAGAVMANGMVTITNSTVSHNSAATGTGGGVYYNGSSLIMTNTTIFGNLSNTGGGGLHRTGTNPTLNMRNTIIAGNTGAAATPDVAGLISSQGNNLIGNTGTSTGWVASDLQNMNPLVAPLGFYGGLGFTHALLTGSPAINGGQNCVTDASCAAANAPVAIPKDERGALREGNVDIGSFEISSSYTALLPSGLVNQPYNQTLTSNVGSFTYSHSGGTLPPGVNVLTGNVMALVNGTPTLVNAFNFGVSITSGMNSALVNYRLNILNDLTRVPVTGRVTDASGRGIYKATVNFTDQNGNSRFALTNGFGYFYFGDLEAGATYTVTPLSKQFSFTPQIVTIVDATDELNFTATP